VTAPVQPSLFDKGVRPYAGHVPFARGSDTSEQAAHEIEPRLGEWQRRVLLALVEPASDEKLEWRLGCERTRTSRPRRRELVAAGYVEDSGRRVESDLSGKLVTVWQLTAKGREAVERILAPSTSTPSVGVTAASAAGQAGV
jgi:hypothetical protein